MCLSKTKFRGGYAFRRFKGNPGIQVVQHPIPAKGLFLFKKKDGKCLVKIGQEIEMGQGLAEGKVSRLYSSLKGRVSEIKFAKINCEEFYCFYIESDKRGSENYRINRAKDLSSSAIEECLEAAHLMKISRMKSFLAQADSVGSVILHHGEADVFCLKLESLISHIPKETLDRGAKIMESLFPNARLYLAVDKRKIRVLRLSGQDTSAYILKGLSAKYPQAMDAPLAASVLGVKLNDINTALDQGIFIITLQDMAAMVQAVETGQYPLNRMIALAGPAMDNPCHALVRIGTPLSDIIDIKEGVRYIENSLLSGNQIDPAHFSVSLQTECIIAVPEGPESEFLSFARPGLVKDSIVPVFMASFLPVSKQAETNIHGEHRACLNCGYCSDVCPAGILPQMLHRYIERGMITENLVHYRIYDCIECGLCSYVCPSKIDLAFILSKGKSLLKEEALAPEKILNQGAEKQK
ncbi:MAG: 4Fe-4S dicluster domain-containing protein [Spirochaetales bacterium]|nr:4Fe-4S dicluster domain-containing protein [Spirochaetales bacterium]